MADQQRQQASPPFFDQKQPSRMSSNPYYEASKNIYLGMQQQYGSFGMHQQPLQQQYRLPDLHLRPLFNDFSEEAEARTTAESEISQQEKLDASGKPKAGKRVTQNETLMSKIATTLLCNMPSFGVTALRKGSHGRNEACEQLIALLNNDAEVMQATSNKPLNGPPGECARRHARRVRSRPPPRAQSFSSSSLHC